MLTYYYRQAAWKQWFTDVGWFFWQYRVIDEFSAQYIMCQNKEVAEIDKTILPILQDLRNDPKVRKLRKLYGSNPENTFIFLQPHENISDEMKISINELRELQNSKIQ